MTDPHPLVPGIPVELDQYVTRIVAPNGGVMTGVGTNTYLVGTERLTVIDPGPDDELHVQAIVKAGAGRIRWILCTHTHFDHSPAAGRLKQLTNGRVGAMSAPITDHDFKLQIDKKLNHEDVIECGGVAIQAIHTPGHASNHLCFLLSSNGMLFTGDHIMQGSTVVIWPPDGNMRAYIESLRRLLETEIQVLAPGHGHLITDPRGEVNRLIQLRLRREEKVRQALLRAPEGTGVSVQNLLPFVYDDVPEVLYKMAARSLQAHLEKLVEDGELACSDGRYSRVRV
jgi:Zn-dependent hydrolases, including glyoxylases